MLNTDSASEEELQSPPPSGEQRLEKWGDLPLCAQLDSWAQDSSQPHEERQGGLWKAGQGSPSSERVQRWHRCDLLVLDPRFPRH